MPQTTQNKNHQYYSSQIELEDDANKLMNTIQYLSKEGEKYYTLFNREKRKKVIWRGASLFLVVAIGIAYIYLDVAGKLG